MPEAEALPEAVCMHSRSWIPTNHHCQERGRARERLNHPHLAAGATLWLTYDKVQNIIRYSSMRKTMQSIDRSESAITEELLHSKHLSMRTQISSGMDHTVHKSSADHTAFARLETPWNSLEIQKIHCQSKIRSFNFPVGHNARTDHQPVGLSGMSAAMLVRTPALFIQSVQLGHTRRGGGSVRAPLPINKFRFDQWRRRIGVAFV